MANLRFLWPSWHSELPTFQAESTLCLATARMQIAAREIVLWTTPSEPPKALQASECSELLDPMRASCLILAQHQPGKFKEELAEMTKHIIAQSSQGVHIVLVKNLGRSHTKQCLFFTFENR